MALAEQPSPARCVIWHPRGSLPPDQLVQALDKPQLAWRAWDNDLLAWAEVCAEGRDPAVSGCVLLLVEPDRLANLGAVLEAVERFRPLTLAWVFDPKAEPALASLTPEEARRRFAPEAKAKVTTKRGTIRAFAQAKGGAPPSPPPRLRLVDGDPVADAPTPPAPPQESSGTLLTTEEVEMLLSDQDPPSAPTGQVR